MLAYHGHPGGTEEAEAVARLLAAFDAREEKSAYDGPTAPRLFVVHKPLATG